MKIKHVASGAFLLNTFLFGSYYAISKEVLGRVDPIVFSFCEMMTLVPPALIILAFSWRHMTRQAMKNGFALGSCLCLGLFMLSVALRYNSATGTAFFPALNGLLAVLFTWLILRQPITKATWFAGIVSVTGAFLLMANADMGGVRGSLIAFIGGLFCTLYIFLADHFLTNRTQKDQASYWPLFAIELLTMALWGNLIALLFGDWNMVHLELPKDVLVILYIGLGTVFLPTLITVLLQRHISPVTVSFISILEPILGALVAYLYLHEVLPLDGYIGGGLIVTGVLIHTWGSVERPVRQPAIKQRIGLMERRFHTSPIAMLLYPLLCCGIGAYIVSQLGGFPPPAWRDLFESLPQFPTMVQQGQGMQVSIMVAQSLSWLIAWSSLILMGGIATYRALEKLFITLHYPHGTIKLAHTTSSADWQYEKYVNDVQFADAATMMLPKVAAPFPQAAPGSIPTREAQKATEATIEYSQDSYLQVQPRAMGTDIDVRSLRQMGYTPYSVSTRPAKRKLNPVLLQQSRLQRRIRLAHVEPPRATEPLLDDIPAGTEQQAVYSDSRGNAYLYWNEVSQSNDVLASYAAFHLKDIEEVQEGS